MHLTRKYLTQPHITQTHTAELITHQSFKIKYGTKLTDNTLLRRLRCEAVLTHISGCYYIIHSKIVV